MRATHFWRLFTVLLAVLVGFAISINSASAQQPVVLRGGELIQHGWTDDRYTPRVFKAMWLKVGKDSEWEDGSITYADIAPHIVNAFWECEAIAQPLGLHCRIDGVGGEDEIGDDSWSDADRIRLAGSRLGQLANHVRVQDASVMGFYHPFYHVIGGTRKETRSAAMVVRIDDTPPVGYMTSNVGPTFLEGHNRALIDMIDEMGDIDNSPDMSDAWYPALMMAMANPCVRSFTITRTGYSVDKPEVCECADNDSGPYNDMAAVIERMSALMATMTSHPLTVGERICADGQVMMEDGTCQDTSTLEDGTAGVATILVTRENKKSDLNNRNWAILRGMLENELNASVHWNWDDSVSGNVMIVFPDWCEMEISRSYRNDLFVEGGGNIGGTLWASPLYDLSPGIYAGGNLAIGGYLQGKKASRAHFLVAAILGGNYHPVNCNLEASFNVGGKFGAVLNRRGYGGLELSTGATVGIGPFNGTAGLNHIEPFVNVLPRVHFGRGDKHGFISFGPQFFWLLQAGSNPDGQYLLETEMTDQERANAESVLVMVGGVKFKLNVGFAF